MATIFDTMTVDDAIKYCYKHRSRFLSELYEVGEDGVEQFDCLIVILEDGTIKPSQLPEYGMDYEGAKNTEQQVQADPTDSLT